MESFQAGTRASANSSTPTIRPTVSCSRSNSSHVAVMRADCAASSPSVVHIDVDKLRRRPAVQEGGMARDAALVSTWSRAVPGREAKAIEVFMEFMQWWGKQAAEGKCSEPEPFFATDGSGGMSVVRGKAEMLFELASSDEALRLISKGQLIVQDL